ncbi:MAG: alpha/beta hydrolase, partial [Succinivibrio sp.]
MAYIPPRLLAASEFIARKQEIESFYEKEVLIHRVKAGDGTTVTACEYRPETFERTLVIIPGRGETEHKYAEFLYSMQGASMRVCVLFARGQGLSDRLLPDPQKCHIRSIASLSSDIMLLIDALGIADFGLMAFSMGGLVALDYLEKAGKPPARCALIAPYIWPCVSLGRKAMECVAAIGYLPFVRTLYTPYGAAYRRVPFDENYHCHCRERYEAY